MYEILLLIASGVFFLMGCALTVDLFLEGFHLGIFIGAFLCFYLAYVLSPKDKPDAAEWYIELTQSVLECPFRLLATFTRILVRAIRRLGEDGEID